MVFPFTGAWHGCEGRLCLVQTDMATVRGTLNNWPIVGTVAEDGTFTFDVAGRSPGRYVVLLHVDTLRIRPQLGATALGHGGAEWIRERSGGGSDF